MKAKGFYKVVILLLCATFLFTSCTTTVIRRKKTSSGQDHTSSSALQPDDEDANKVSSEYWDSSGDTSSVEQFDSSNDSGNTSSETIHTTDQTGKTVVLQTINTFVQQAEAAWDFDGSENFIDYCENLDKLSASSNVALDTSDTTAIKSTGESKRFVAQDKTKNGVLIYKTENIAAFSVTIYTTAFSYAVLQAYTSEDRKTWNPISMRFYLNQDLTERYARIKLGNDENINVNQKYLKLEFMPNTQIGQVGIYSYHETSAKAPYEIEYAKSSNLTASNGEYRYTDSKMAWIEVCRYNIYAAAYKIRYKGAQPAALLRYSTDATTYTNAKAYRTPAKKGADGFYEFYVITGEQLPEHTDTVRLYLNKPDNSGKDAYISEVSVCAGNYIDDCSSYGELYQRPANLKLVKDKEYTTIGATENCTTSFVINKNDIKGFDIGVRAKGNPTVKVYVSKDCKNFTESAYYIDDYGTGATDDYTHFKLRNKSAIPADSDYLKIEFSRSQNDIAEIESIYTDSIYDPVRELKKICSKKGVKFSDVFSIAHVGSRYTHSTTPSMIEGMDILKEMGGTSINLWPQAGLEGTDTKFEGYIFNSEWENNVVGQINVMKTKYVKEALSYSNAKTFVISINPDTGNVKSMCEKSRETFDAFLKKEYQNMYDFCIYMLNTYKNSGKKFIISTWESDWWFGNYNSGYDVDVLDRFAEIINNRQKAFNDARAKIKPQGMELYNCLEVVDMRTAMDGNPCVTTRVLPQTKCDMYAYSAYDTAINEVTFEEAMQTFRKYAPTSELLGDKNLFIGEIGLPEMEFGYDYTYTNLLKSYKKLINNDMQLGIMWQLYCNEAKDPNDLNKLNSHDNNDYRGFWLIRADGTKTPIYNVFRMALK